MKLFPFTTGAALLVACALFSTEAKSQYPGGVSTAPLLWLKAGSGVTQAGNQVSQWNDQSPNGNNVTQATTTNMPGYDAGLANFNPTLTFNSLQFLTKPTPLFLTTTTYSATDAYIVSTAPFPKDNRGLFGQYVTMTGAGGTIARWMAHGSFSNADPTNYFGVGVATNGSIWSTYNPLRADVNPTLWSWSYSGSTNRLRYNGGTATGQGATAASFTGANSLFAVGAAPSEAGGLPTRYTQLGNIPELLIFNTALSAVDRDKVETYFAIKYGITIGGHNYFSTAYDGTNAATTTLYDISSYGNAVAGIGRNDAEVLYQKQSRSAAPSSMVTIGRGSIAANNASNNSTLPDGAYLIWGDNGGAVAWQTAASPANRQRLTRQWKATRTGTVAIIRIRVPANTSSETVKLPAELGQVYLLTDADGDFSSGASETALTLVGTNWEATVAFSSSLFFTFATPLINLPVSFTSFTGTARAGRSVLKWSTATESNSDRYEVQHSINGTDFTGVGSVAAAGNSQTHKSYDFTHESVAAGTHYYRLKQIDRDGRFTFSNIVRVDQDGNALAAIIVSPNPVTGSSLNLKVKNLKAGKYAMLVFNEQGVQLLSRQVEYNGTGDLEKIELPAAITRGVYTIRLQNREQSLRGKFIRQ